MNTQTIFQSFFVEFDAIIELCAGFEAYFEKHPEEEGSFPRCNDPVAQRRKRIKSREMFIGRKTDNFCKLLQLLEIEVDSAFLEAEYYLTPPNGGKVYEYKKGIYSIAFDFHIDPTAQIEVCKISLSFPKEREEEIMQIIGQLSLCSSPTETR